ncbi:MAG: M48 family metalloprotease [bacterium]|nr:M48 family metalloprotease [bacterium]
MRSLGPAEIVVIAVLVLLFLGGSRISRLFGWLGTRVKSTADQARWVYESLGGSEDEEIQAEQRVGDEAAEKFLAQTPADPDQRVQAFVQRVGDKLARVPGAGNRRFSFHVVLAGTANAYALPGGHVFVTSLLADLCAGDEDETAFLLGHEMGHVLCRQMAERKVVNTVLGAVRTGKLAADLMGAGYSREQEREADWKAVDLAREAGFEAAASLRFMRKLGSITPEATEFAQYFSTHPATSERLEYIQERVA